MQPVVSLPDTFGILPIEVMPGDPSDTWQDTQRMASDSLVYSRYLDNFDDKFLTRLVKDTLGVGTKVTWSFWHSGMLPLTRNLSLNCDQSGFNEEDFLPIFGELLHVVDQSSDWWYTVFLNVRFRLLAQYKPPTYSS